MDDLSIIAQAPEKLLVGAFNFSLEKIEEIEGRLLEKYGMADLPVKHVFGPDVYCRILTMPKGSFVIGHQHLTEHLNVVIGGVIQVAVDGGLKVFKGGDYIISKVGGRKIGFVLEDTQWMTIHPTTETDVEILESTLVRKSQTFQKFELSLTRKELNV